MSEASPAPIIAISGLRKVYRIGKINVEALRGVDLTVRPGEFLAIAGPSGSGKSTLFNIVGGLTPPTAGSVTVDGRDLAALDDAGRARLRKTTVSFVFQKFNLLPNLTAGDNIGLARFLGTNGKRQKDFQDFNTVLQRLGIAERLNHKPSELSGGEQQRVAIARAIVNRPAILLADEPTGNLDTANSLAVLEILQDLNRRFHQTILMITHNPEAAAVADRVVHMRDGSIID